MASTAPIKTDLKDAEVARQIEVAKDVLRKEAPVLKALASK